MDRLTNYKFNPMVLYSEINNVFNIMNSSMWWKVFKLRNKGK